MSTQAVNKANQSGGNPGFCHNISRKNKKRDGKQQKFGNSGVCVGRNNAESKAMKLRVKICGVKKSQDRTSSQADSDRNTDQKHDKERNKKDCRNHFLPPPICLDASVIPVPLFSTHVWEEADCFRKSRQFSIK